MSAARWPAALLFTSTFVIIGLLSFTPIRSYDYFWHLATGRWIVEHHALPLTDPFAVASSRIPWINGEWLFQPLVYLLSSWGGHLLTLSAKAFAVGLAFALVARTVGRFLAPPFAFLLTLLAWWACARFLDVRPSTVSLLLVVLSILILQRERGPVRAALYAALSLVWINVHPSALLAPSVAALWEIGVAVNSSPAGRRKVAVDGLTLTAASLVALLINPFGVDAIRAPLALTEWVSAGQFTNSEWLPSDPRIFPLLYLSMVLAAGFFVRDRSSHWISRLMLFLFFAFLAARSVRHQPLYFVSLLPLVAPSLTRMQWKSSRLLEALAIASGAALIFTSMRHVSIHPIVRPDRFPVRSVEQLKASGLAGNVFNADQFGGYLINSFYPQRRALTDGRNELYRTFIPEDGRARHDERAWKALLEKYDVALAVDEYRPPVEVKEFGTGFTRRMPAVPLFYPRAQWALIGFDDVAVVMARRARFDPERIAKLEFVHLLPDRTAIEMRRDGSDRSEVAEELRRARRLMGEGEVLLKMERAFAGAEPR